MDFLIYLTPLGNEIITKIISKNYIIKENACRSLPDACYCCLGEVGAWIGNSSQGRWNPLQDRERSIPQSSLYQVGIG